MASGCGAGAVERAGVHALLTVIYQSAAPNDAGILLKQSSRAVRDILQFKAMALSFIAMLAVCAALIAIAVAFPVASINALPQLGGSTCAILNGSLPKFCSCADGSDISATLTCSINPMGLDQMSLIGKVQPCNKSGATIDLRVQDTKYNVSYAFPQFDANTNGTIPVPGTHLDGFNNGVSNSLSATLTLSISGISLSTPFGSAGVYANYNISGDASAVSFGLNVDVCVVTFILTTCASTLGVPDMPVTLINGTYDFSSLCT